MERRRGTRLAWLPVALNSTTFGRVLLRVARDAAAGPLAAVRVECRVASRSGGVPS